MDLDGNVEQNVELVARNLPTTRDEIIKRHYTLNYPPPPDGRWSLIDADSSATTNLADKTITFKKILFTQPVNIVDSNTNTESIDITNTLVSAATDSIIRFEDCLFNNASIADSTATTNIFNCNFSSDATTDTIILPTDSNGQLITTRDGIIKWYGESATKEGVFKQKIRRQLTPTIISRSANRGRQFANVTQPEIIALHLLRQMVSDESFKKYLKHGFVTVEGPSGLVYQIIRKSHNMYVWKNGQKVASLCVYLKDNTIPPTDEVVAKILICQCDEIDIWRRANIRWRDAVNKFRKLNRDSIKEKHIMELAA
jgi:hypothetical protein